ncbi:hypothetical protein GOM49_06770 [Clostridium bovifaecis]|uniref:Uncharacterized protein n=1 Tax=Clostridium bovifaecis TaxID=2184719 RepID=A0A6I6EME7_9CLOT|nr:hypothetical protein GOM49_06770 [Clostridium bovifaecis]
MSDSVNKQKKDVSEIENEHRIDQLVDVVEKHTRTERHLEQYSNIGNSENREHAREIQKEREEEINTLKNIIAYGDDKLQDTVADELDNLEKNYIYSEGYLEHNAEHMPKEDMKNLKEKQENRREKMRELKFK